MPRIVTMIASATEIVCALGFEKDLVARSHECDFPPSVQRLPICTAPRFDVHGSSLEIDERVKSLAGEAVSIYRVDADMLRELRPDVIVTQAHCEVCAVSEKDVEQALATYLPSPSVLGGRGAGGEGAAHQGESTPSPPTPLPLSTGGEGSNRPKIVSLSPNNLADVWQSIRNVADALGVSSRGDEVVRQLQGRVDQIARRAPLERPTVACLEWLEPLMAAGNWVPELVELAGGQNLFGEAGKHSPWMTWEQLSERDPDVIIALPCGFDLAKTRSEMAGLTTHPAWPSLRAVRNRRVFVADGNQFFNRPGPRLVESLEILAEILHPDRYSYRHEGIGWQKYSPLAA